MKAVTIKQLKDELSHKSASDLKDLCLHLARFKKENKELLTYLLFESHDEESFIATIKEEVDLQFSEINTKSFFLHKKKCSKNININQKTHSLF